MNMSIFLHDTGKLNPKVHGKKTVNGATRTTYYNHEASSMAAVEHILGNLPGTKVKEIERIKRIIDGASRVNPNYTPTDQPCNLSRKALGKFLRLMGDDWKMAICVGIADASAKKRGMIDSFNYTYYASMLGKIEDMGPDKIIKMRSLLDGNEIISIIDKAPGAWVGNIVQKMIEWQLKNPNVNKEDAVGFTKSFRNN